MRTLVVSGMALIAVTYGLARFGYGLFLPQLTETFGLSPTVSGAVQAGSFLSYCLAAAVAARTSARPRAVVAAASGTATLGAIVVAAAPTAPVLALGVVVAGAGAGLASPGLVALVRRNAAPAQQENAQTVVNAGTGVGIVAAGGLMVATAGHWRTGWVVIALLAALATAATLRADRARPTPGVPRRPIHRRDLARLARPLAAAALAGSSSAAVWTFGRSVMADSRTDGQTYSVVAWMLLGIFGVLGAGAGRVVQVWDLRAAWVLTAMATASATAVVGLVPGSPVAAYAAMALFGASYTALSGVLIVWAVRVLPDHAAEGTVALFIGLAVGQAVGAVALGALLGPLSAGWTFVVAGVVGTLSVLPVVRAASPGTHRGGGLARAR